MATPLLLRAFCYFTLLAGLLAGERLAPFVATEQKKAPRVFFHVGLGMANSVVLYLLVAGPLLAAVSFGDAHHVGLRRLLGLAGWQELAATLIVFDLWDYWMHRWNHRIPLLWRFHRAHHSDMEIDVTTASRFHPGELFISATAKCLAILLWGPSLQGVVLFDLLLTAFSQFHHSNLGLPLRLQDRLETIVVTPRMHRCHHALHRECAASNYATILSSWDRLFGSYHRPRNPADWVLVGLDSPRGAVTMRLVPFLLTPFRNGRAFI